MHWAIMNARRSANKRQPLCSDVTLSGVLYQIALVYSVEYACEYVFQYVPACVHMETYEASGEAPTDLT